MLSEKRLLYIKAMQRDFEELRPEDMDEIMGLI